MKCPYCREATTDIFNSRATKFGTQVWRRRRCLSCNETFTTYEAPDLRFLQIRKGDKKPKKYSRATLFSSIYMAFTDMDADPSVIDAVTDTVETKILDSKLDIIASAEIAEIVLQTLKNYHTGAFVRYLADQTHLVNEAALRKQLKKY